MAELELYLLGECVEKCILTFGREFTEHEVAIRLPLAPYMLELAGIEHCEGHEVVGRKNRLRPVEVALGILYCRILLAFLEHLPGLEARDADALRHAGDNHDKTLAYKLIARGCHGEDAFKYLTVVIGIVYFDCHC